MVRGRSRRSPDEFGVVRSVAENYIPPIIAEVIARVTKFKAGMDEAKAAAASAARDINVSTDKIQGSTERAAEKSGAAWKAQGAAAKDAAKATAASADAQAAAADRTVAAHARVARQSSLTSKELAGIATAGKYSALGLAAVGVASVKLASDYQGATTRIAANAQISVDAAKKITDAFLGTAGSTIYSAQQIATAYGQVAGQMGVTEGHALSASQALRFMKTSMDLAEGSGTDLSSATSALSTVMRAFHLSISDAAGATDILFNVSRETQVPLDTLAGQFAKLHSRLGELAPNLKDVGTLMSFPSIQAAGSRGLLAVNSGLQTLLGGSKKVDDLLQSMNIHLYDSQGQFVGLRSVIEQLSPVLADMNEKQRLAVERTILGKTNVQLLGQVLQSNVSNWDQYSAAVGRSNSAHEAAVKQSQTFQHQVDQLKATLLDLAVKLGQILVPALQSVAGMISTVVNWFDRHTTAAKILAGVIAGVLTTAIVVFTTSKLIALVNGIKTTLGAFQSLGGYLTGGFSSSVDTASGKVTGMANNVGTQMTRTSTTLTAAEGTIGAETKAIGGEFDTIGASANANAVKVGGAMTKMEGEVVAAEGPMAADGAALGAAFTSSFLAALGPAIIAFGVFQAVSNTIGAATNSGTTPGAVMNSRSAFDKYEGIPSSVKTLSQLKAYLNKSGMGKGLQQTIIQGWLSAGAGAGGADTAGGVTGGVGGRGGLASVTRWQSQASYASSLTGIPVSILLGQIQQESGGNPLDVSSAGAFGLSQFIPSTARQYGVIPGSSAKATQSQITGQALYLKNLVQQYGSITAALEAYYGGAGGVANPNEAVAGGPTPAQYAEQVLAKAQSYGYTGTAIIPKSGGGGSSTNPLAAFSNALQALSGANTVASQGVATAHHTAVRHAASHANQATSNMQSFLSHFGSDMSKVANQLSKDSASESKQVTAINDKAMKQIVANAIATGKDVTKWAATTSTSMSKSWADAAKQVTATAIAAYKSIITTMTNLANRYATQSSGLGTLYGVTGALGLTDSRQGVTAQELPLVGSNFQNPGQMLAYLGAVSQGLEAGGGASSQANYAGWAKAFGGTGSQLGTYFTNLASGKLKPADVTSTLGQVYSLIGSIVNLETSLSQNTAATTANTTATVDNTTVTNAATGPASSPGPTINVYTNDLATGQAFASQLYLALRPILVSPNA